MLLVGTHINKIDKKGRVSVPKPLRDSILKASSSLGGDGGYSGLFAFPSFKEEAIRAADEVWMQGVADRIDDMDEFSDDQDDLAVAILESAHQLPFDPEGRIVLPPDLIAHAGIQGEVLFAARGKSMMLWAPDKYAPVQKQAFERAKARRAVLKKNSGPNERGEA